MYCQAAAVELDFHGTARALNPRQSFTLPVGTVALGIAA